MAFSAKNYGKAEQNIENIKVAKFFKESWIIKYVISDLWGFLLY